MSLMLLFGVFVQTVAYQHQYEALVDEFVVDYIDNKLMDLKVDVIQVNKLKGLNFYFTSKVDIPASTMITAEGFKWVGNDYRIPVLQIRRPLKEILQMELFDFQTLWVRICRPPMVWPIQKNVTYRINNWVPNSTNFPPNLPSGKWSIRMTQSFANRTKFVVLTCFARVEYLKSSHKLMS